MIWVLRCVGHAPLNDYLTIHMGGKLPTLRRRVKGWKHPVTVVQILEVDSTAWSRSEFRIGIFPMSIQGGDEEVIFVLLSLA